MFCDLLFCVDFTEFDIFRAIHQKCVLPFDHTHIPVDRTSIDD